MLYLLTHQTVADEDEEPLQTIADGEDVSHRNRLLVDIEQTEYPRAPQQNHQHNCSFDPRTLSNNRKIKSIMYLMVGVGYDISFEFSNKGSITRNLLLLVYFILFIFYIILFYFIL